MKRLLGTVVIVAGGFGILHELGRRWGATREELTSPMPGDEIVPNPKGETTHGITIHATPREVWPWIVQMGYHRGGWYTYAWVDRYVWRIQNPSADRIEPELQDVSVGSVIPDGEPGTAFYVVRKAEPPQALVLHSTTHVPPQLRDRISVDWTWSFQLMEVQPTSTRLTLRVRAAYTPWWMRLVFEGLIVPSDFVMARSMLRGIRRRAQRRLSRADHRDATRRTERVARNHQIPASRQGLSSTPEPGAVDLLWIPLGAGDHVVRVSGRIYEAIKALRERRPRLALYHSALEVTVPEGRFVIESAPIPHQPREARGVVAEGPVGLRWAGRFRLLRYEIRRWREGSIPDANEAVSSPIRVATDLRCARQILELVPCVPTPVWGRDELETGDMWNSNSLTSWLLVRSGVDAQIQPPRGGRAPGWDAGLVVAARSVEIRKIAKG